MVRELLVKSSAPNYLELVAESPAKVRGLCHQFGVVPQSVVAVYVTFLREDLTHDRCIEQLQGGGADSQTSIFECVDEDCRDTCG